MYLWRIGNVDYSVDAGYSIYGDGGNFNKVNESQ